LQDSSRSKVWEFWKIFYENQYRVFMGFGLVSL
jgi:hypothetical protein